jgi:hypothetical protein
VEYHSDLSGDPDQRIPTRVYTWGNGSNGKLGHGNTTTQHTPSEVKALKKFVTVQLVCGGSHTMTLSTEFVESTKSVKPMGIDDGGRETKGRSGGDLFDVPKKKADVFVVFSFGWNLYGQLGHGDNWDVLAPKQIVGLKGANIVKLAAGNRTSMAMSGTLSKTNMKRHIYAWGHGVHANVVKERIHASIQCTLIPRPIMGMQDSLAKDIIAGNNCSFVLATRGAFKVDEFDEDPAGLHPEAHKWHSGSARKVIAASVSVREKVLDALRLKGSKFHGNELVSVPDDCIC